MSRALAAYAVHKLAGAAIEDTAKSIVDGGGDGGLDAVYYSPGDQKLWIIQSKFIVSGRGEPVLGDFMKFIAGIRNLLNGKFEAFEKNEHIRKLIPILKVYFNNAALQVRAVIVYSGTNLLSEDRRLEIESVKAQFSAHDDYLDFLVCNLTTIHDWLTEGYNDLSVEQVELALLQPGWVRQNYETIYGLISLEVVANLYRQHGKKLIATNIRGFKGRTEVNDEIMKTIKSEAQRFFYLNNGLTAYCKRLEVSPLDRANQERKRVTAKSFSIVNGAQTLGSIAHVFDKKKAGEAIAGHVFIKIISLEKCEDDKHFAERITRSTNFQNQVGLRDFAAQYEQQLVIERQLMPAGVCYHYKSDVDNPPPDDKNFTLEEATTACACLAQYEDCDFVARILANRASLWSFEKIYKDDSLPSRCERVFRPDRSARTVWRAVQVQRIAIDMMQGSARAETGARKAFFENARWLVLNVLFLRLRPQDGNLLSLSADERTKVSASVNDISEMLFTECERQGLVVRSTDPASGMMTYQTHSHFRSIFSQSNSCRSLRNGLLNGYAAQDKSAAVVTVGTDEA